MIDLHAFTAGDRNAFQGVEQPDEGEPMIGPACVGGPGWTEIDLKYLAAVIVDRGRLGVNGAESAWQLDCTYHLALTIAKQLDQPIQVEQLRRWGFIQIA